MKGLEVCSFVTALLIYDFTSPAFLAYCFTDVLLYIPTTLLTY